MAEVTDITGVKKLQVQLGIPFFIMVGFVIGVLIFGTLYFGSKVGGEEGRDPMELALEGVAPISSFVRTKVTNLNNFAEQYQQDFDTESAEEDIRSILASNKDILAIALFNEVGNPELELHKARTSIETLTATLNGNNYLGIVKGRTEPYFIFSTNTVPKSLHIALPLLVDETSQFNGFLVATIDATYIVDTMLALVSEKPAKIQIADNQSANILLTESTLSGVGAIEGPSKERMKDIFLQDKKEFGYKTDSNLTIVSAWEEIDGTSWNLVAHTFRGELTGAKIAVFTAGTIFILLFVALALMYIYILNAKLITPLKKIEKAMHYYKTGDYSEEIKVATKNELAGIAQTMNNMARNIENNTSERVSQLKKVLDRQNTDTKLLITKDVELREKSQKLKELDAAKSMFVSVAAHQMRTPLAAVKWAIKLVMDGDVGPVNAEQVEYLDKGYQSTTRMINLINDLLNVDKIESDKFTYEFLPISLTEILQGIVDDLTPISTEKGVHLIFEHEKGDMPKISGDQVKLTNALQNLIDNAIKYTIGGGDVTVKLELDKEMYKLSIKDTGIGIPLSEQGKVFGKFFRAKNAVRQQTDGSGLGLFIVKKIIEKHKGTVTFESKEKIGTTFNIEIPFIKS